MKASHLSFLLLCAIPACISKKHIKKVTVSRNCSLRLPQFAKTPSITVWVHGTRFVRRPFFYSCFDGVPSLRLAQNVDPESSMYEIAHLLNKTAPDRFPLKTFYTFGWSGKLSSSIRQKAARCLYKELQRIVTEYEKTYNVKPYIKLLTHSHGGTVALNLARIKRKPTDVPFTIDELVLLACPVQKATKQYIENDIFKYTCALYSGLDMVQILAPQFTDETYTTKKGNVRRRFKIPFFSNRKFEKHPKLAQAKVKVDGRALFHTEFTSEHFISILPHILHVMHSSHKHTEYDTQLLCVYTRDEDD